MPPRRRLVRERPPIYKDVEGGRVVRRLSHFSRKFSTIFGFPPQTFKSFDLFNRIIHREVPGHSLAVFRIFFGILLFFDILEERGFNNIIKFHNDKTDCKFPLFYGFYENAISPSSVFTMAIIYIIMNIAVIGFTVGYYYRMSCFTLILSYSLLLLKDKINWSNHSFTYVFVLCLMLFMNPQTDFSIDSYYYERRKHPLLWNYVLIRFQVYFLLIFSALKKLNLDWIFGYPVEGLSSHWLLGVFRYVIGEHYTNIIVVHYFGLLLDVAGAYLLFFDRTRNIVFVLLCYIYTIYLRILNVGYFPYFCLISFTIFYPFFWPMSLFINCKPFFRKMLYNIRMWIVNKLNLPRWHLIYPIPVTTRKLIRGKIAIVNIAEEADQLLLAEECWEVYDDQNTKLRSKFKCIFLIFTVLIQFVVLQQCYWIETVNNTWTSGLYGYAWDPMYNNWEVSHFNMIVKYYPEEGKNETDHILFPLPNKPKWVVQTNMYLQLHLYVEEHFPDFIAEEKQLIRSKISKMYPCLFISLNGRFFQRLYHEYSMSKSINVFDKKKLIMPLLPRSSKMDTMLENLIKKESRYSPYLVEGIGFVDFKGMKNYYKLPETSINSTLHVFKGTVYLIQVGDKSAKMVPERGQAIIEEVEFCIKVESKGTAYYAIVHKHDKPYTPIRFTKYINYAYTDLSAFQIYSMFFRTKWFSIKRAFFNLWSIFIHNCYKPECFFYN